MIALQYRRPGFNCVVKQLRFWLFKVDCEFKDCDLRVLRIGHTCVIYTLLIASSEKNHNSQSLNYAIETRPTVSGGHDKVKLIMSTSGYVIECQYRQNFIGKQ